ncbi:MAG: 16S rRNA (cytosine(967)-C(5))-methyltransferase RsmB [Oscillospiraceae bacterium]|nr:16S rRNA (cytosine(967)-C(5))-methyltransferase RsmB [Oscillospiraceae bacterium]
MNARGTALSALIACRKRGAWSDSVLKTYIARDGLDQRDAALASRLCYGVIQNRRLLDFYIAHFLTGSLQKLQPVVLDILRLGAYQIALADRIPDSAAVNEAVEQAKKYANPRAAGLVNGVLRAMSRAEALPQPGDLATRFSHSPALVELFRLNVGDELLEPLLKSHNETPPTTLQVNTLKTSAEIIAAETGGTAHPWLPDCVTVAGVGDVAALPCFTRGEVYAQDAASRLAVLAADPGPGMRVLDCCAAPGGKSFACAIAMENRGEILSCDLHENKLRHIEQGAARLGLSIIRTAACDAREFAPERENAFDLVLCDAPCSGLGVIRKKPDIREKDLGAIAALPQVQLDILRTVGKYVKPGGVLLYSTCTILKRENEEVVRAFLQDAPFAPEDFSFAALSSRDGMLTLLPCVHGTDGFFIAKLRK